MGAGIRGTQLRAGEHQELPAAAGSKEKSTTQFLPQCPQKKATLPISGFWTLGLLNCERMTVVLNYPDCGNVLCQC